MNRVASPEYPDSIHDVIYQKGQYSCVNTARFAGLVPTEECVDAALRLLCGERRMVSRAWSSSQMTFRENRSRCTPTGVSVLHISA